MAKRAKCFLFHKWDGCKCTKCLERRDSNHTYVWRKASTYNSCALICKKCYKEKTDTTAKHDFQPVEGKCDLVCTRCGEVDYYKKHSFKRIEGKCQERCEVCGETVQLDHKWIGRMTDNGECEKYCKNCGETELGHWWKFCKCKICGQTDPKGNHNWKNIQEGNFTRIYVCDVCGKRDESKKITLKAEEMERILEEQDSMHDMRAAGIRV